MTDARLLVRREIERRPRSWSWDCYRPECQGPSEEHGGRACTDYARAERPPPPSALGGGLEDRDDRCEQWVETADAAHLLFEYGQYAAERPSASD